MRRPRSSIAELLIMILVIALDCAALRAGLRNGSIRWALIGLGTPPMGTLLAMGLLILARQFRSRGWASPVLVGFEIFGGIALLDFTARSLIFPDAVADGIASAIDCLDSVGIWSGQLGQWLRASSTIEYAFAVLILLPQLLFAVFGAWLLGRYRFVRREPVEMLPASLGS